MSHGGVPQNAQTPSVPATGATGASPATSAPSGGKGGAGGANPNPYAQQSVYNPPAQQSYYDQAFGNNYNTYNPQQSMQTLDRGAGLGGLGNAYAFRRGPQNPMGAMKPMDEMRMYPGYDNPQFDGFQGGNRFSRYGGQQYPTEPAAPMEPGTMRQRYGNPFSDNVFADEGRTYTQPRTLGPESLMGGMRLNGPGSPEDPFAAIAMPGNPRRILEGQGPSGGLASLMGGMQQQNLDEMMPSGFTRAQENAGYKKLPDGTIVMPGV